MGLGGAALINTASWATVSQRTGMVVLECDDGTFAFLAPNRPVISGLSTASVGNAAAIRRAGLYFKFPVETKIESFSLAAAFATNTATATLTIYDSDGTTVLVSVDVDANAVAGTGGNYCMAQFAPITLAADTFYRAVLVATAATTFTVLYIDVSQVGFFDGLILGQNAYWTQYDGSAWAQTTTRVPYWSVGLSALHDGTGGGGGGATFNRIP